MANTTICLIVYDSLGNLTNTAEARRHENIACQGTA
jgi:hypothetical protein